MSGEEHGGEDAVDFHVRPHAGQELFDLPEHRFGVAHEEEVVLAGQLHVLRFADVLGEVAAVGNPDETVPCSMQGERRHRDRWQHPAKVSLQGRGLHGPTRSGAHR
jgi:hypothetical protein